ncbi:unnamed protein product, partial [Amoebophrya sp. A25]|eukprot:GSA25T00022242001.1
MTKIYEVHNPDKLSKIPGLLVKYADNPLTVYNKLCDQYKVPREDLGQIFLAQQQQGQGPPPQAAPQALQAPPGGSPSQGTTVSPFALGGTTATTGGFGTLFGGAGAASNTAGGGGLSGGAGANPSDNGTSGG